MHHIHITALYCTADSTVKKKKTKPNIKIENCKTWKLLRSLILFFRSQVRIEKCLTIRQLEWNMTQG